MNTHAIQAGTGKTGTGLYCVMYRGAFYRRIKLFLQLI